MNPALDLLARHLADRRRLGQTRLHLGDPAREALRRLPRPRSDSRAAAAAAIDSAPPDDATAPVPSTPSTPSTPSAPDYAAAGDLASLRRLLESDAHLAGLPTLRDRMVFAVGTADAPIVLVGEAPGQEEERRGEPFVGPAGRLLDKILGAMQLGREGVYISNIVKYRPRIGAGPDQGSANRKPSAEEMAAFRPIVLREIELIAPKVVIALGGSAHQGLLGEDIPVGRARGQARPLPGSGIPVLTTYHPSYLLRLQGSGGEQAAKRLVWEDMLQALELAGLPITARMRGYFLPK